MANEITFAYTPAATLTAALMAGPVVAVSGIALNESPAGWYTGSVPIGTAAGIYAVRVMNGATTVGTGELDWSGTQQRRPSTDNAAAVASAVQAMLDDDFSALAAAVWAHSARTLTSGGGGGANAAEVAAAVMLATAGAGTAGAALARLNFLPVDSPIMLIPDAPTATGMCRVYGYLKTPSGRLGGQRAKVTFKLMAPDDAAVASERLISGRAVEVTCDDLGALTVELARNDMILPAGTFYAVTSADLGIKDFPITLNSSLGDLRALLTATP